MDPDILVIPGEKDLFFNRFCRLLLLGNIRDELRVCGILSGELEEADEHRQLVEDVMPGYVVEQVELVIGLGKGFHGLLMIGNVHCGADDYRGFAVDCGNQRPSQRTVRSQQADFNIPDPVQVIDLA